MASTDQCFCTSGDMLVILHVVDGKDRVNLISSCLEDIVLSSPVFEACSQVRDSRSRQRKSVSPITGVCLQNRRSISKSSTFSSSSLSGPVLSWPHTFHRVLES